MFDTMPVFDSLLNVLDSLLYAGWNYLDPALYSLDVLLKRNDHSEVRCECFIL